MFKVKPLFGTFLASVFCGATVLYLLGIQAYNNFLELIVLAFIAGTFFGQSFMIVKLDNSDDKWREEDMNPNE